MSQSEKQIVNPSGCFIFLQAKKMIDPADDEQYSAIQKTFFSTSISVGLFSFLWARFYELGKYKFMIPNRLMFYVVAVGGPSITHAFYRTNDLTNFISQMDQKYYEQYKTLSQQ
ncbi:unnamed protein product [Paramecium sonneborni]|uniref:Transmembrane protein n=1 Tax=Paramecium sonneborni TaxID=65129 RepID=A0A8S1MRF5_9CILI|nr:unnamed protein product [Paramecium sonneborni]